MRRGTTPTIWVSLPFDLEEIEEIWLTVSQRSREILTKSKEDMHVEDDVRRVSWKLTQKETLRLEEGCKALIQVRVLTTNGEAFATNEARVPVDGILKEGVI